MNEPEHTVDERPVTALVDMTYFHVMDMVPGDHFPHSDALLAELARRAGGLPEGTPLDEAHVEQLWKRRLRELAGVLFRALARQAAEQACLIDAEIIAHACASVTRALGQTGIHEAYADEVLTRMGDTLLEHVRTGQVLQIEIDGSSLCLQAA